MASRKSEPLPPTGGFFPLCSLFLFSVFLSDTPAPPVEHFAGAVSSNDGLNTAFAVGAGLVSAAYAVGAVASVAAGSVVGGLLCSGVATLAGTGSYACVADYGTPETSDDVA